MHDHIKFKTCRSTIVPLFFLLFLPILLVQPIQYSNPVPGQIYVASTADLADFAWYVARVAPLDHYFTSRYYVGLFLNQSHLIPICYYGEEQDGAQMPQGARTRVTVNPKEQNRHQSNVVVNITKTYLAPHYRS